MRLFQNSGIYRAYHPRLRKLTHGLSSFSAMRAAFLRDRFGAAHFLAPVLANDPSAFLANGDDEESQRAWASGQGLADQISLEDILLSQIEHHRTEIFYNLDPVRYGDAFLARLPSSVKRTVAWRAAPYGSAKFLKHDIIVNNFPSLLDQYRSLGARAEYFFPAHDPEMDPYAVETDRPIDIVFVGTYSRHHIQRARMLEALADLCDEAEIVMHLDVSRMTRLAESAIGVLPKLRSYRRPRSIRRVTQSPVFGRELLETLSRAKIVLNGAIDMAGKDRGNMRIWEALGCGCAMVTDDGRYPPGLTPGTDFVTYGSQEDMIGKLRDLLASPARIRELAVAGRSTISTQFSKTRQWDAFKALL